MYLIMNTAIIGVIPWSEAVQSTAVVSDFMAILYGRGMAQAFTLFILWTLAASTFALLLGYSRIPFAAARDGGFFRVFAVVHPVHKYPAVSLLSLGVLTAAFCYLPLGAVIDAAVTVRIVAQFIVQIVALHVLRTTRPDMALPFRMWLYPLPSLVALTGWIFIVATSEPLFLWITLAVLASGCIAYPVWQVLQRPKSDSLSA
jgi:amino acid transporter